jgi:FtsZ-interacting cell division protein ZipA
MNTIMLVFNILYIIAMLCILALSIHSWRQGKKNRQQFLDNALEFRAKAEQQLRDQTVMADIETRLEVRLQDMEKRIMEELKK